jgi:hypothetical protein
VTFGEGFTFRQPIPQAIDECRHGLAMPLRNRRLVMNVTQSKLWITNV